MKDKLELRWVGKDVRPKLEPRILLEDSENSHLAARRVSENDIFDNRLIFGNNLLALKALEQTFGGKVKCVFIDPPYNTGTAFEHFEDGLEHSVWLSLMRDRLELIWKLLSVDGSLWVTLDDNEAHYFKVMADEIFGRANYITSIAWEKRTTRENRRVFSFRHDYVLVFAKNKLQFERSRNPLPISEEVRARYKNPDNDIRGPWQSISANAQAGHGTTSQFYTLVAPNGRQHEPPKGTCWRYAKLKMDAEISKGNIWFGKDGNGVPRIKKFLRDSEDSGLTPETIWYAVDVGTNDEAKKGAHALLPDIDAFDNPKPEKLIARILEIATNPGELVLDSFGGSGTTGAVAHKMGRRWIMIELGEHCHTHIIPRLRKVINGEDEGGISKAVAWRGGGGYRYYRLAPSLISIDKFGNEVINPEFNKEMLAEAVCKLEGFTYEPSEESYWQHGKSADTDFIYITTQTLTHEQLAALSEEVGDDRTLLVCCAAFRGNPQVFSNLTVKKIPKAVLHKCQWDWDEYEERVKKLGYKAEHFGGLFAEVETEDAP